MAVAPAGCEPMSNTHVGSFGFSRAEMVYLCVNSLSKQIFSMFNLFPFSTACDAVRYNTVLHHIMPYTLTPSRPPIWTTPHHATVETVLPAENSKRWRTHFDGFLGAETRHEDIGHTVDEPQAVKVRFFVVSWIDLLETPAASLRRVQTVLIGNAWVECHSLSLVLWIGSPWSPHTTRKHRNWMVIVNLQ